MTFKGFMMRNHRGEKTPAGVLANDIRRDEDFPSNGDNKIRGWYELYREYLEREGASSDRLQALDECWQEYVAYVRTHRPTPYKGVRGTPYGERGPRRRRREMDDE